MNQNTCDAISPQLVEYADGELAPPAMAAIFDHLKECKDCRAKVSALRSSLEAAGLVWRESELALLDIDGRPQNRRSQRPYLRIAALAASIALLVSAALLWRPMTPSPGRQLSPLAVASQVDRVGIAAQLLAAADLLAEQPGGLAYASEGYRYVATHYSDTDFRDQALSSLQQLPERSTDQ